jgi:putative spermidine/putrescine transport system substrate-binding protein
MSATSRRTYAIIAVAVIIVACIGVVAFWNTIFPPRQQVIIAIPGGTWEENFREHVLKSFYEKYPNIEVIVSVGSPGDTFMKIVAAKGVNPPYDVFGGDPAYTPKLIEDGLVIPWSEEKMPFIKDLYPSSYKGPIGNTQDGVTYGSTFTWGRLGIAFRKDLVTTPPKTWLDFWRPDVAGHIGLVPLTHPAGKQFFVGLTHQLGGVEGNPSDTARTFRKLAELKGKVAAFPSSSGTIESMLTSGEIWMVPLWDGRTFGLAAKGVPVSFVYPEPYAIAGGFNVHIAKGTKNEAAAVTLVNHMFSAEAMKNYCEAMMYSPSLATVEMSEKFYELSPYYTYGEETYARLIFIDNVAMEKYLPTWVEEWIKIFA